MSRLDDPKSQQFVVVPKRTPAGVAELVVGRTTMDKLRAAEQERRDARRKRRR